MFVGTTLDRPHGPLAIALWREAASWMSDRGQPIWDDFTFDEAFLERERSKGEIIGVLNDSDLAAVALLQWNDDLWSDRRSDRAAYVHKVATARAFAGTDALGVLFQTCVTRARNAGKTLLRLDTPESRPALHAIYRGLGFTMIDTTGFAMRFVRFEMPI